MMIRPRFSFGAAYRYAIYARMSSDSQNARSPEQQIETIRVQLNRCGWNWTEAAIYIDRGISGRRTQSRPEFQRMRRDIKTGRVTVNVLLVDTVERFSRATEGLQLRQELERLGVIMMTADSGFSDPTTSAGELLAMFEAWRAKDENRVKSHNVLRGKRDTVLLGYWPGGPPPLGYKLQQVPGTTHCILVPDPATLWIVHRMFELADTRGWGMVKIAADLNADPTIPDEFKPFSFTTVGRRLANRIYIGEMEWGQNHYDIRDDARIGERAAEEDWTCRSDFCTPIIDPEVFDRVNKDRQARADKILERNENAYAGKSCCGTGIALRYLLSGLVVCRHCSRAMVINVTKAYVTKEGESKTYPAYVCPGWNDKSCLNSLRVPEPWLRETVVNLIRTRLFGTAQDEIDQCQTAESIIDTAWYRELVQLVEAERTRIISNQPDQQAMRQARIDGIANQQRGRMESLVRTDLNPALRRTLEDEYGVADQQLAALNAELQACDADVREIEQVLDPNQIATALNNLADIMGSQNVSAANLILSQHVASIACDNVGHVTVKTCKLGGLSGCADVIHRNSSEVIPSTHTAEGDSVMQLRKRTKRRVECDVADDERIQELNLTALNPARFVGLGSEWFWADEFHVPAKRSWPETNALEVARYRIKERATQSETASHFQVSAPTIRKALDLAKVLGVDATDSAMKLDRKPDWAKANAVDVAKFIDEGGATIQKAVDHFRRSEPTISKALHLGRKALAD